LLFESSGRAPKARPDAFVDRAQFTLFRALSRIAPRRMSGVFTRGVAAAYVAFPNSLIARSNSTHGVRGTKAA